MSFEELSHGGALVAAAYRVADAAIERQDFVDAWLESLELLAMPEASGLHFDGDQVTRLSWALRSTGVRKLVAVPVEEERSKFPAYTFEPSTVDLGKFSFRGGGFNYLVLPTAEVSCAVLCSAEIDTLLIAGTKRFLLSYFGNLRRAAAEFWTYSETYVEDLRPKLRTYLRHADWVGGV